MVDSPSLVNRNARELLTVNRLMLKANKAGRCRVCGDTIYYIQDLNTGVVCSIQCKDHTG